MWQCTPDIWTRLCQWTCKHICICECSQLESLYVGGLLYFPGTFCDFSSLFSEVCASSGGGGRVGAGWGWGLPSAKGASHAEVVWGWLTLQGLSHHAPCG